MMLSSRFDFTVLWASRGSALVTALILAIVLGIAIAGYLRMSATTLRVANRAFLKQSTLNLAEGGLEHALNAIALRQDQGASLDAAWSGWTTDATAKTARRTLPDSGSYTLMPGAWGNVKVHVSNYDLGGTPVVVAKATATLLDGSAPVVTYLQLGFEGETVAYGLAARTSLTLNSNAFVDSWRSDPDGNPATAWVPYSSGVRRDGGSVAVAATGSTALTLDSNAYIYGSAAIGGTAVTAKSNSRIRGATSPASPRVDPARLKTNATLSFANVTAPNPTTVNTVAASWTGSVALPRTGDTAEGGVYYYRFNSGRTLTLDNNDVLTINAPAVLIFGAHAGTNAIDLKDNARITNSAAGRLSIYTNSNVSLLDKAMINEGSNPAHFSLYGTHASAQTITLDSDARIHGRTEAPNAGLTMLSNAMYYGSVVMKTVFMDSNAQFHVDESTASGQGAAAGYRVAQWRELQTAAERELHAAKFNF